MSRVPVALALSLVLQLASTVFRTAMFAAGELTVMSTSWAVFDGAFDLMMTVLMALGAFELARRVDGRAARAAKAAGITCVIAIVFHVVTIWTRYALMTTDSEHTVALLRVEGYVWAALAIVSTLALVIAAGGVRRARVPAGVVSAALVAIHLPYVAPETFAGLFDRTTSTLVFGGLRLVLFGGLLVVLAGAPIRTGAVLEDGTRCETGFRRAAAALYLRVAALGALSLVIVLASGARRTTGAMSLVEFVLFAGPVINAVSLALFAHGALQIAARGVRDVSRIAAYLGGLLSLWAAGVVAIQVPWQYYLTYRRDDSSFLRDHAMDVLTTFSTAIPIVAAASVVVLLVAILGLARKRGLDVLYATVWMRTIAFVVLVLVAIALQKFVLPEAATLSRFLAASLVASGAGLIALVAGASACQLAAGAVHQDPGLPTATARITGPA